MRPDAWQPPIVKTVATENKGITDLVAAIERYREFHQKTEASQERRQAIARWRILELLREQLLARTLSSDGTTEARRPCLRSSCQHREPHSAVRNYKGMRQKAG